MSPKSPKITIFKFDRRFGQIYIFHQNQFFGQNFLSVKIFDHVQHFGHVQPAHDLLNAHFPSFHP